MKRVPTVKPYSRRTMRALAIVQGLLIIVSLMVPFTAMAAITSVTVGAQAPNPVTAGSTTSYTVTVTNGSPATTRGISISSIAGLPAGASLQSSTCASVAAGGTGTITVVVATTAATPAGTSVISMIASRWNAASGNCNNGVADFMAGAGLLVVAAAPLVGTTTTITSDLPDPSTVNVAYTVNVSVTRASGSTTITGTVTVSDGTDSCTDPTPTGGAAVTVTYSCALTSTTTGAKTLTASFPANASFSASSGTAAHAVSQASQIITFPALSGVRLDQAAPATAATASSSLPVTYSTVSTACSVTSGGVITLLHAGTCTIAANQAGNAIYSAAPQVSQAFTIAKGDQTISFGALADQSIIASPVTIGATATSGLTVAFASNTLAVCTVSGTSVTLLTTGTCSITASQAGNADWNAAASTVTRTFQVTPGPSTTVVTCPASVVYDGSAQTPCTVSVTGAGGLNLSPTPIYTLNTDVGTASADYTYAGDANHTGSSGSDTFDITSATSSTVVTCPASVVYDGSAQTPCTVSVTGAGGLNLSPTPIYTLNTDVGTASADYTYAGDANHTGSSGSDTFDITSATSSTVVTCPASVVYDGSAQTPCTVSVTGAGGLNLSPTPIYTLNTDVGTATADYTYAGDANHTGSSGSDTFDITSATSSTVVTCPASVVYDGSAQTPCTVSVTGAGGLNLSPTPIYTLNTDVGTATADYTYAGDANHTGSSGSDTFDITTADTTTVVTFESGPYTYSGSEFTATAIVTGGGGLSQAVPVVLSGDCTNVTVMNGCTATATFAGDATYNGSSDSQSITITQASQTIDFVFDADASAYAGSFELTATADSSLPVTFTSLTQDLCTVSDTTATVLSAGTCTIEADQAGDANFAAAAPVTQTVAVTVAGAAPAPPDTSLLASPLTTPVGSVPLVLLIGALTAAVLAVIFVLMALSVIKRQREADRAE